jgi:predicted nucleic acid-binding protein
MSAPEGKAPKRFVVDTNVFVAAVKPFSKRGRTIRRSTGSLALLVRLINDEGLELFGNRRLIDEYTRLAEELGSETSSLILGQLASRVSVVEILQEAADRCGKYLPEEEAADVMHAVTSLQAGAVLITNDTHFDRIKESGLIRVWSIGEAIRKLKVR